MTNPFVYIELHTRNLPEAKKLYRRLFAWELAPPRRSGTPARRQAQSGA